MEEQFVNSKETGQSRSAEESATEAADAAGGGGIRRLLLRPIDRVRAFYRNHEARLIALRVFDKKRV